MSGSPATPNSPFGDLENLRDSKARDEQVEQPARSVPSLASCHFPMTAATNPTAKSETLLTWKPRWLATY
ncbi:MAG: hypothetical protein LC808_12470, partial [Actinobacteria bacterium]|nr:hypothetical protein [Actinomycetota bacterium]